VVIRTHVQHPVVLVPIHHDQVVFEVVHVGEARGFFRQVALGQALVVGGDAVPVHVGGLVGVDVVAHGLVTGGTDVETLFGEHADAPTPAQLEVLVVFGGHFLVFVVVVDDKGSRFNLGYDWGEFRG